MNYYAGNKNTWAKIVVDDSNIVIEVEEQVDFESEFKINLAEMVGKPFKRTPIWKDRAPFQARNA